MKAKLPGAHGGHHIAMTEEMAVPILSWMGSSFLANKLTFEVWVLIS